MPHGKLQVLLVGAKGLQNSDILCNMDPYVALTCHTQEKKSTVASGKGSDPQWNESFEFAIADDVTELKLKIMDSDAGTEDDFVGEVVISLGPVFTEGEIPPAVYNVVKEQDYCGEIKLGLTFTQEAEQDYQVEEEDLGGWKQSSMD